MLNSFLVRIATDGVTTLRASEERAVKEAEFAIQHDTWKRAKEKRDEELADLEALEERAALWRRAENLRAYLHAVRDAFGSGARSGEQQALIDWGLAKADWLDPLVNRYDEVLDAALDEPRRNYW